MGSIQADFDLVPNFEGEGGVTHEGNGEVQDNLARRVFVESAKSLGGHLNRFGQPGVVLEQPGQPEWSTQS